MTEKCKHLLKERSETKSVFCGKLDQWISAKYCEVCRFCERVNDNHQNQLLHSYNYSYNIAHDNQRERTREQHFPIFKDFIIASPGGLS